VWTNLSKQRPAAKLTIDLKFRAVFSPSATRLKRLSRPTPCSMRARQKYEAGDFDEDAEAADFLQQYEARIAALERLVDKQALELEFIKGAVKSTPRPKNATTSVVVGPRASASQKDAG
jgi:hypothetical protein